MQLFFSACSAQPIYGCHRCHRWMIWQISKSWACWDIRERQKDPPQRLWVGAFCQNCQCLFLSFARSLDPKHSVSFAPWQAGISRRRQGGLSKLNKKKELLIDEQTISMQKCLRFSGQQRRSSIRLEAKNMHACRNLINNKAPSAEASWGGKRSPWVFFPHSFSPNRESFFFPLVYISMSSSLQSSKTPSDDMVFKVGDFNIAARIN